MSLSVEGVTKRYGRGRRAVVALDNLSLAVDPAELLVVVGPSGSGKSSLLRVVAGLEAIDEGRVVVQGRDVTAEPPATRGVAMVFQDLALYPHLSVEGNLEFDLGSGSRPRRSTTTVGEALERLDLMTVAARRPAELSGGERQRVALARALVRQPDLLLLDEPFSTVDAEHRHAFRREILRHQRELGLTTLLVTHDSTEAMDLGDRIAVLDGGRVVQAGTPSEVWNDPATLTVARRFGDEPINELVQPDGSILGVRPSTVLVTPSDVELRDGEIEIGRGSVSGRAELGDRVRITISCGPHEVRSTSPADPAQLGGAVTLRARAQDVLRFDAGGRRIL